MDKFSMVKTDKVSPFDSGVSIDVSTEDQSLPQACRGFYVANTGNVRFTTPTGNTLTITSGDAQYHPWRVSIFHHPETTATGIVAGW